MSQTAFTRRGFLKTAGTAAAAFTIVPRHVVGQGETPPSEKLNIACIGLGWPGCKDVDALAPNNNIVALCDVDASRAPDFRKKHSTAKQYQDYRRMFDELDKSIDAVIVATPDHSHAMLALAAIKRGKHVYCEKPLAHSIYEVRQMMQAAQEHKVITQLGNQGHSSDSIRLLCEWIWDGAIGNVHTIHAGCSTQNSALNRLADLKQQHAVPAALDWEKWLGPAQQRPYHPHYLHEKWRAWMPFGNGTIGDWTCHVIDPVFWALDLGAPTSVQAQAKDYDPRAHADTFPWGDVITYEFPAKGKRGPITLIWHSGTERIPRPKELEADRRSVDTGAVVYGDKGTITYGSHGAGGVRIIPETRMREYKQPQRTLTRVPGGGHEQDWARAVRAGQKACSDFAYGGPLTEVALLGVIAIKLLGTKLEWDSQKLQFTNCAAANLLINPPYRTGWSL